MYEHLFALFFVGVSTAPFGDRANKCFAFSLESDNLLFTLLALNEQILYGTISFRRVKRIVLEDEELLGE